MRSLLFLTLLSGWLMPVDSLFAQQEYILEEPCVGVPVQTAIYTRRYGAVETEDEIALQELEAGQGVTDTFKFVSWRGYYRPYGYAYYGPRYFYSPRYYVGYGQRYFGYYPSYTPYWGGYWGNYYYSGLPYATYYAAPRAYYYSGYRGLRGYGGCWYW